MTNAPTGRRLFVLDDCDALVLYAAAQSPTGDIPAWATPYTLDAMELEGYLTPASECTPLRLSEAGWARWTAHEEAHNRYQAAAQRAVNDPGGFW